MHMQAIKAHRYGNAQHKPGDRYEVRAADVRLVKALGWAIEAQPPQAPRPPAPTTPPMKRAYTRKVVRADVAADAAAAAPTDAATDAATDGPAAPDLAPTHHDADRTYLRRDLVAEGE